jgi:hypothetical protein
MLEWLGGDEEALDFVMMLSNFVEYVDDTVDGDKPVTLHQAVQVMTDILCRMPFNKFYQAYAVELRGMMLSAILAWAASEELKGGDETDKALAFVLRDQIISIFHTAISLKRGFAFAQSISKDLYRLTRNDNFAEYSATCQADQNQ